MQIFALWRDCGTQPCRYGRRRCQNSPRAQPQPYPPFRRAAEIYRSLPHAALSPMSKLAAPPADANTCSGSSDHQKSTAGRRALQSVLPTGAVVWGLRGSRAPPGVGGFPSVAQAGRSLPRRTGYVNHGTPTKTIKPLTAVVDIPWPGWHRRPTGRPRGNLRPPPNPATHTAATQPANLIPLGVRPAGDQQYAVNRHKTTSPPPKSITTPTDTTQDQFSASPGRGRSALVCPVRARRVVRSDSPCWR